MMVTNIKNPDDPTTEKIIKTASRLGITHYRLGYIPYKKETEIFKQLEEIKAIMTDMTALNEEYKIFGGNPNANANLFASSIWDEWYIFKDIKSKWIGYQLDITHAVQEGGGGSWRTDARLIADRIGIVSLNTQDEWTDPNWRNFKKDSIKRKWNFPTPTEFNWIFNLLKEKKFSGPISVHYEYPLGGVDKGVRELKEITREKVLKVLRTNLKILRDMLKEADVL
jgi:sugar phosphate isomerase/epimerase